MPLLFHRSRSDRRREEQRCIPSARAARSPIMPGRTQAAHPSPRHRPSIPQRFAGAHRRDAAAAVMVHVCPAESGGRCVVWRRRSPTLIHRLNASQPQGGPAQRPQRLSSLPERGGGDVVSCQSCESGSRPAFSAMPCSFAPSYASFRLTQIDSSVAREQKTLQKLAASVSLEHNSQALQPLSLSQGRSFCTITTGVSI